MQPRPGVSEHPRTDEQRRKGPHDSAKRRPLRQERCHVRPEELGVEEEPEDTRRHQVQHEEEKEEHGRQQSEGRREREWADHAGL